MGGGRLKLWIGFVNDGKTADSSNRSAKVCKSVMVEIISPMEKGKYLFNEFAMAKVFRARFLTALNQAGFCLPENVPPKWVVDCKHVCKGISAVKYLSRYLYRGVISEKNIVSNQNGRVTFRCIERKTGNTPYRTLKGEDFLHLIMQHVLPKGFRRVRDFGFLHGNAKKMLFLVQLILHVVIKGIKQRPRPVFKCPRCKSPMVILGFRFTSWKPGQLFFTGKGCNSFKQKEKKHASGKGIFCLTPALKLT